MMDLRAIVKNAYCKDMICAKTIALPDAYPKFGIQEGLIWMKNQLKRDVICILQDTFQRGRRLIIIIIDHAHQTIGHYGQWKASYYIQQSYWWPQMATDIEGSADRVESVRPTKPTCRNHKGFYTACLYQTSRGSWWVWTSWDHCPGHKAMITCW